MMGPGVALVNLSGYFFWCRRGPARTRPTTPRHEQPAAAYRAGGVSQATVQRTTVTRRRLPRSVCVALRGPSG